MKSKKMIIIILLLIIVGISFTTALYKWQADSNTNINVSLNGYENYINYTKGTDTLNNDLEASSTYTDGLHSSITIGKKSTATNIPLYAHIYLDINEIGTNIAQDHGLKWVLTEESSSNVIASGDFYETTSSTSKLIKSNIELTTTPTEYTVWLYLLESDITNNNIQFETLDFDIKLEVTGKSI